jgi:hypothetical protein
VITDDKGLRDDFIVLHEFPGVETERNWRKCLSRGDFPTHYAAPEFFLEQHFADKNPFAVLSLRNGCVVGILSGVHEGRRVVSGLPSRPQVCLDATVDPDVAVRPLVAGLLAEAENAQVITVYSWAPLDGFPRHGFRFHQEEGVAVMDLSVGPDVLFRQLDRKRRNGIRYALRQGLEILQLSEPEHVREYYEIHLDWCGSKKIPPLPYEVMASAVSHKTIRRVFVARSAGKIIAGSSFRFTQGGLVEYAGNNSLREYQHLKPNELLVWHAINWASNEGFRWFSFGGAHRFLREFGGRLTQTYRYRKDLTFLHRYELRESVLAGGRELMHQLPESSQNLIRHVLRRSAMK